MRERFIFLDVVWLRTAAFVVLFFPTVIAIAQPVGTSAAGNDPSAYRLIGTIEGADFSGAVISTGKEQLFYRLHERLPDGSQVMKIRNDSITLKRADGVLIVVYTSRDLKSGMHTGAPPIIAAPEPEQTYSPAPAVSPVAPRRYRRPKRFSSPSDEE